MADNAESNKTYNRFDDGQNFFEDLNQTDPRRVGSPIRDRIISEINKLPLAEKERLLEKVTSAKRNMAEIGSPVLTLQSSDLTYLNSQLIDLGIGNVFDTGPQSTSLSTRQTVESLEFHLGASIRAQKSDQLIKNYYERLHDGINNGDIVYMTNTSPCPKFNFSKKSPYNAISRVYTSVFERIKSGANFLPGGTIAQEIITSQIKEEIRREGVEIPEDTINRAAEFLQGKVQGAYKAGTVSGYEFERESYSNGLVVPVDLGKINGGYRGYEDVSGARNEQERMQAINDKYQPFPFPSEAISLLELASNGKKLDPEYASLIIDYVLQSNASEIEEFAKEYERFKNLPLEEQQNVMKNGGIFSSSGKKSVVIGYCSLLAIFEVAKLGDIIQMAAEGKIGSFKEGLSHHTPHNLSKIQGYLELGANIYKTIYYFKKGKYLEGTQQAALGAISFISEFATPENIGAAINIISPELGSAILSLFRTYGAYGGYVGLAISAIQFTKEVVVKPIQINQFVEGLSELQNELLDLEREAIEKECCTKINPGLYRKSKGQLSVLMTPSGYIPFETQYRRSVEGESKSTISEAGGRETGNQPGPCQSNGEIPVATGLRYIKVLTDEEREFRNAMQGLNTGSRIPMPVYKLVDPRNDKDPCKTKEEWDSQVQQGRTNPLNPYQGKEIEVIGERESDIGEIQYRKDITPGFTTYWSDGQEKNLQDAIVQYNSDYISDVYKFKMDAAKCKTNEIPTTSPYGGGGAPDRDGFYAVGESGMTAGFHRIGSAIIARQIFETRTLDNPLDTSTRRSSFWNGEWEVTTREYGFNVGGGGAGTGTKLRGITSFFYDPLNPPKPIRQV